MGDCFNFVSDGRIIDVFGQDGLCPAVYLNCFERKEGEAVYKILKKRSAPKFTLISISNTDWDNSLSPWESDPVFKSGEKFGGGGENYLKWLLDEIIPLIEENKNIHSSEKYIAGYSLAGLFAVWASYKTDEFTKIASASGSLWFPGFLKFAEDNEISKNLKSAYFSLGDKEDKTKNEIMKTVRENTVKVENIFNERKVKTCFKLNNGNHYQQTDSRQAAAIEWILRN